MNDHSTTDSVSAELQLPQEVLKQGFWLAGARVQPVDGSISNGDQTLHLEPRVMDVLVVLASKQGQVVTRDELMNEVWQGSLVTEDALARCIYQLRQHLPTILDNDESGSIIETVHKKGFKLNLAVSAEGIAETPGTHSPANTRWILLLLTTVVIIVAVYLLNSRTTEDAPMESIAVLAFNNMTGNDEYDYLADGFSEQLSHALANVPNLKVAARTSAFYFRDNPANIPEIARQLDVEALLEGSIRINGGELRVTAQLIRADGFHMASHEYNRPLTDLLRLQSEVTDQILIELGMTDDEAEVQPIKGPTDNYEAYDLYLRGRFELTRKPPESYARAAELFEQAIELDQNYALAYSGIADVYSLQLARGLVTTEAVAEKVESAITRALELDEQLAEANASRGLQHFTYRRYAESEPHYRRAIELNPNYISAHNWLGLSLVYQDRFTEAIEAYQQAQKLDPLDASLNRNLGANLLLVGRPDEGLRYLTRSQRVNPESARPYGLLVLWNSYYGRLAEAAQWRDSGLEQFPEDRELQLQTIVLYTQQGDWARAGQALSEARQRSPDDVRLLLYGINLYLAADQPEALDELLADFASPESPFGINPPFGRTRVIARGLMIRLLQQGRTDEAIELVNANEMGNELVCGAFGDPGPLMYLAHAYRQTGQTLTADNILADCLSEIDSLLAQRGSYPRMLYRLAMIHVMRGEYQQGENVLRQAIELGWNHSYEARNDPLWQPYRNQAPFDELFSVLESNYGHQTKIQ